MLFSGLTPTSHASRPPPWKLCQDCETRIGFVCFLNSLGLGGLGYHSVVLETCLGAKMVQNLPAMQETWVRFLGQEDPLEKEMANHSSILVGEIPWTEEPGGLQSMGSQRIRHD